jgi:metallo-beta-lactamase family protein
MKRFTNSLSFLGGTETVTGSRYLIEVDQQRYLVDCGLFQGYKNLRERNRADFPVPADTIDFILLTHAHLDHSGYVPAMIRQGFKGRILTTPGTAELLSILWPDSAHLLEEDAERANRKGYTKHAPAKPLYDIKDVEQALQKIKTVPFGKSVDLAPNVSAEFQHAGHILGAAQLHLKVNQTSIHFSGDLGRANDAVMNPPADFPGSDILVVESTYGDRTHPKVNPEDELAASLKPVLERGGTAVIPAFAVGRTQALMLHLWRLVDQGRIPRVPIFVNSPMALNATQMYHRHQEEHKVDLEEFESMYTLARMIQTVEDSKALNQNKQAKIIISASGMITGGRVLHHIKAFGPDPKNAIVITGYQAGGTRGSQLVEGLKTLRIFGQDVPIEAEVIHLQSMSAHADGGEIIDWMRSASKAPKITYVTHGEPAASDRLRFKIADQLHWKARAPFMNEVIDLDNPA